MKCPTCSSELVRRDVTYFTGVKPDYTFRCDACKRTLMVFTVTAVDEKHLPFWAQGLSQGLPIDDLLVWTDELPRGQSFTDFIEEKMEAHRVEQTQCECGGKLKLQPNIRHFDNFMQDYILRCEACRQTYLVIVDRTGEGDDQFLKSEEVPPGGDYPDYIRKKIQGY